MSASPLTSEESLALRQNLEQLRRLVETSQDFVAEITRDGQFLYVSPRVGAALGYDPAELMNLFDYLHAEDASQFRAQFALEQTTATLRFRHKDRSWRWMETTGRNFSSADGSTHRLLIARDVTDRVKAEEAKAQLQLQLRQTHKLEALGTLAGGIAHDFNNILGAIMGYTELALMDVERPDDVRRSLAQVRKATVRGTELVQQILMFSRKQKQERKPTRLQVCIKEALELMRHALPSTIQIHSDIDPRAPAVLADATQFQQVIINLCTNAAHAMRKGPGRLTIALQRCDLDAARAQTIHDLQPGCYARVTISDNGHGMDPETLKHIFEPFFTTKDPGEGTGLGLAVVHGIVREHGAGITVRSQPDQGTTVDLYFPALESLLPAVQEDPRPLPRGHGQSILLVDDEPALCASQAEILKRLGYRVTWETNPVEALRLFSTPSTPFDLAIIDLIMPHLSGVDLAEQILLLRPRIPVLLTSGSCASLTADQARQIGTRDLLRKPSTSMALAEAVHRALHRDFSI